LYLFFAAFLIFQVELSSGTNVLIAASEKDQLKVDYRNKAASLAKETLFALFGKEVFRTLNVTAIGQKEGTYAIRDNVKQAIIGKFEHCIKFFFFYLWSFPYE
jgi:hypothetical protein